MPLLATNCPVPLGALCLQRKNRICRRCAPLEFAGPLSTSTEFGGAEPLHGPCFVAGSISTVTIAHLVKSLICSDWSGSSGRPKPSCSKGRRSRGRSRLAPPGTSIALRKSKANACKFGSCCSTHHERPAPGMPHSGRQRARVRTDGSHSHAPSPRLKPKTRLHWLACSESTSSTPRNSRRFCSVQFILTASEPPKLNSWGRPAQTPTQQGGTATCPCRLPSQAIL